MNITSTCFKHLYVPNYRAADGDGGATGAIFPVLNVVRLSDGAIIATVEIGGWAIDYWVQENDCAFVDMGEWGNDEEALADEVRERDYDRRHADFVAGIF